jgi:LytS/YehU family sensor histidine kinase
VLYYRRTRDGELRLARVEGQLARAQVQALNAQLRPHFLFNALHTIGQLWRSGRADEADALLDHLGALFQTVQGSTARTGIRLAEELEMVREYLAIEEARFRDRMRVAVEATRDASQCVVPPLILQPLVENAVRDGVSATSRAGLVTVSATTSDGRVRLTVTDDGPGPNAPATRPGAGTGLSNTRERLAQLYGDAASLTVAARPEGGTVVTVDLPRDVDLDS